MKPGEPAAIEAGDRLTSVGVELPIVNVAILDSVPPGFSTCTLACPVVASRLAGTVAVSVVAVTAVGANVVPRNTSCDPPGQLVPVTVNAKAGAPTAAELLESVEMTSASTENGTMLEPGPCSD